MDPEAQPAPAPAPQPAPPAQPAAAQLQAALDNLNHPSHLDLTDRIAALKNAVNVMGTQLMPLLPTE